MPTNVEPPVMVMAVPDINDPQPQRFATHLIDQPVTNLQRRTNVLLLTNMNPVDIEVAVVPNPLLSHRPQTSGSRRHTRFPNDKQDHADTALEALKRGTNSCPVNQSTLKRA